MPLFSSVFSVSGLGTRAYTICHPPHSSSLLPKVTTFAIQSCRGYHKRGSSCSSCSSASRQSLYIIAGVVLGIVVLLALLGLVIRLIVRNRQDKRDRGSIGKSAAPVSLRQTLSQLGKEVFKTKVKLLVSMYQMLGLLGLSFQVDWPEVYQETIDEVGAVLNLDLVSASAIGCDVPWANWHLSFVLTTSIPLLIVLVLAAARRLASRRPALRSFLAQFSLALLLFFYPSAVAAVFSAFGCRSFELGGGLAPVSRLEVDLSIDCDSAQHSAIRISAMVMVLDPC